MSGCVISSTQLPLACHVWCTCDAHVLCIQCKPRLHTLTSQLLDSIACSSCNATDVSPCVSASSGCEKLHAKSNQTCWLTKACEFLLLHQATSAWRRSCSPCKAWTDRHAGNQKKTCWESQKKACWGSTQRHVENHKKACWEAQKDMLGSMKRLAGESQKEVRHASWACIWGRSLHGMTQTDCQKLTIIESLQWHKLTTVTSLQWRKLSPVTSLQLWKAYNDISSAL